MPSLSTVIPKTLDECYPILRKELGPEELRIAIGSDEELYRYHHGLGQWIRNTWRLWHGSELALWFNGIGINHPDDMSGIILTSFRRHLRGEPIDLEAQVLYYKNFWAQQKATEFHQNG